MQGRVVLREKAAIDLPEDVQCAHLSKRISWKSEIYFQALSLGGFVSESLLCCIKGH